MGAAGTFVKLYTSKRDMSYLTILGRTYFDINKRYIFFNYNHKIVINQTEYNSSTALSKSNK